jgi:N-carbamoyl-L-amino-acid hydrolase
MSVRQTRRGVVLRAMAAGGLAAAWPLAGRAAELSALRIDAARLRADLEGLSVYGRPAGGTFADGVSRVAYSDADVAGRAYVMGLLREAGETPRIDTAGNIRVRREGSVAGLKAIMIGSHIDSVPGGGNFDGDVGSLGALAVLRALNAAKASLRHPLELAIWSNEEGGTIGSGWAAGVLGKDALEGKGPTGVTRADGLRKIGGDPDLLADAVIPKGSLAAYLELHIEQSGLLEKAGVPIGVVDGIVAIDEYEVEIKGFANHAGTTPMPDRKNALLAAAKLIQAVQEEVTREPGRQVGTVGHLEVSPNARNVVPGLVKHTIELRDLDAPKLNAIAARIQARAAAIAAETKTEITIKPADMDPPAIAAPRLQTHIEAAASGLGLKTMHLPSGAGHDAAMLAFVTDMAMIFVPSVAGISHSPHELTRWEDCANGANVLLQTVLRIDAE